MITQAIIVLVSVLIGYALRDFKVKKIKKKLEKRPRPNKSAVLEYRPQTSAIEDAEKVARANMQEV
jgi:hypothetical protein